MELRRKYRTTVQLINAEKVTLLFLQWCSDGVHLRMDMDKNIDTDTRTWGWTFLGMDMDADVDLDMIKQQHCYNLYA
jgi:hypothetical protein